MVSGTSVVTEKSPYYVRTSFTLGQQSGIIADWAIQNGSKKAVMILSDWAPGAEAGKVFAANFTKGGGQVLDTLKVPLANPDFSPFLQRAHDLAPDTLFVFVPAGQAGHLRQAIRRARPRQSPASSWSDRATSSTTTICRPPATRSWASSPRDSIPRRIRRSSTRTMSRPTKRRPAIAPISFRSAAMTACI